MNKKYLVIGGAGILGFFMLHRYKTAQAAAQDSAAPAMPAALYSLPVSSGVNTAPIATDSGGPVANGSDPLSQLPQSSNTAAGSTTMTSPDMTSLLSGLLAQQAQANTLQQLTNEHTADSQALTSLNVGPNGGTATLTHSATGTTLNVTPTAPQKTIDPVTHTPGFSDYLDGLYQKYTGHNASAAQQYFWGQWNQKNPNQLGYIASAVSRGVF